MKVVYSWLKDYVGEKIPSAEEVENLLTFHAFEIEGIEEVSGEKVIDVDVLPNRAHDCLSHRGIAREIAMLSGMALAHDPFSEPVDLSGTDDKKISVTIEETELCNRYSAIYIIGVRVGPSPDWLRGRLEALGQKSVNNIVDAANFVMLSLGQPLHVFDAGKLEEKDGKFHIGIRRARSGEKITTLTGEEYELDGGIQLITDAHTDMPIGIAGIKGGKHAEVDESTTDLIIESAHFDPTFTRKASQQLRLRTDASMRYENEPSRELTAYGQREVVKLIEEIAGGKLVGYTDEYPIKRDLAPVKLRKTRSNELLGISLTDKEVEGILDKLDFTYESKGGSFFVTPTFERLDILIEEDMVEEIGRIYGYEHVQSVVPEPASGMEINKRHYYSEKIRKCLIGQGFSEVITTSFQKKDSVHLANALAADKEYLRSTLHNNLEKSLNQNALNMDLLGLDAIRIFEIGTVFTKKDGKVVEHVSLAIGVRTKKQGHSVKDDVALKEIVKNLEELLGMSLGGKVEQGVYEADLDAILLKLDIPTAYESFEKTMDIAYRPFSQYPFISRDIALWVPSGTEAEDVKNVIAKKAGDLLVRSTLFDEFEKGDKISYAFRLVFQSNKKTLTDSEVNTIMDDIVSATKEQKWEVR